MPWLDKVSAVLEAWYPGEEDGSVVADLLFGKANPSGKLTVTFPASPGDVPAHTPRQYPGVSGTAVYSEDLRVGYRWYDSQKIEPLFPFGFGLSYTTFAFGDLHVSPQDSSKNVHVTARITNTGAVVGSEVAELYIAAPAAAGEPPHQLKGFAKVSLAPGQSTQVSFTLTPRAFSVWNTAANRWTIAAGKHEISLGDSSRNLPLHANVIVR
jgi:beta-glucosidase